MKAGTPYIDESQLEIFRLRQINADLLAACKTFLRAPSIGSSGPGSVTIEVQTFNLNVARDAIANAEATDAVESR